MGCQEPLTNPGLSDGRLPQPRSQTRSRLLRWLFEGADPWQSPSDSSFAVAATIAIGLAQTGKSSSNSTSTTTLGSVPTIFVPEPLDPTVTAVWVGANRVRFSWREQDAQRGDSFWWQIEGSAKWNTKARNSVTLEVTKGSKLCIVVEVDRDDFTLKADSLPKCVVG